MKSLLVFVGLVVATHALGPWKEGLSVRWSIGIGAGTTSFIPLPQTSSAAKNSRWVEQTRANGQPLPSLVLMTPSIDDAVIGLLFDDQGDVAGLQIALPQDTFTDAALDWGIQGFTEWTAAANSSGVVRTYWVTTQYFVSEETLAKSAAERAATRKGRILQEDYVYVTGFDGELMPISTVASEVANTTNTHFTRQSCIPFMGRHYYFNSTKETECTSRSLLPWFTLVDQSSDTNQLVGTGFVTFGKMPASSLVRDYFERPFSLAVRVIVPDGPECMYNLASDPGRITMHIYYVDAPLLLNCFTT